MISHRLQVVRLIMAGGLLHFVFPRTTHAYLDPGSASYVLQMAIAASVAAGFVVKAYWAKLKSFLTGLVSPSERRGEQPDDSSS